MKKTLRVLAFVLALVLALSLVACSGKKEETKAPAAGTTAAAEKEETQPDKDAPEEIAEESDTPEESEAAEEDTDAGAKGLVIEKAEDLATLRISVQKGTVGDFVAQDIVGEENVEKQIEQFEKYIDAIMALKQGKVDATVMDENPAKAFVQENDDLEIGIPLTEEDYAIAVKKGNKELLDAINGALLELQEAGETDKIIAKYDSGEPISPDDIDFNVGAAGGKLVMGTEAGFYPYEMREGDDFIGIDVEIAAAIAKKLDYELVIEDMAFDALITALNADKIDIAMAGMTVTEERKENVDFTEPYVIGARQVVVTKKDQ